MSKPIHRDGQFAHAGSFERRSMRIAGEHLESQFRQAPRRHRGAPVPWRRENGIRHCSEQLSQKTLPVFNIAALGKVVSGWAELTFLAFRLVVEMCVAVLMNAQAFRMGYHAP